MRLLIECMHLVHIDDTIHACMQLRIVLHLLLFRHKWCFLSALFKADGSGADTFAPRLKSQKEGEHHVALQSETNNANSDRLKVNSETTF